MRTAQPQPGRVHGDGPPDRTAPGGGERDERGVPGGLRLDRQPSRARGIVLARAVLARLLGPVRVRDGRLPVPAVGHVDAEVVPVAGGVGAPDPALVPVDAVRVPPVVPLGRRDRGAARTGVHRRGPAVRRPQREHRRGDDRRHDRGGHRAAAESVEAFGAVPDPDGEAAPVEARGVPGPCAQRGEHGGVHLRARRLQHGERPGVRGRCAGPRAARQDPLGGAAALGALVHVPHQLPAQRTVQQYFPIPGEPCHGRAAAPVQDGERDAGALHLAGAAGEQQLGAVVVQAEHGGDLVDGQVVAHGQFQGLALLGARAGGLRPGERGQLAAARGGDGAGELGRLGAVPLFGEAPQAGPAGQRVQPGPVQRRVAGGAASAALPFGDGQGLAQGGDGRLVLAHDGQAVREQPVQVVQVGVEAHRRLRRSAVRATVRPVCAGGMRGVLAPSAHHPADRRRKADDPWRCLRGFNPYG